MEIITIIAIVLSPAIAVLVSIWVQSQGEKRRNKKFIFSNLMSTRHQVISDEIVRALNMIDVVFRDKEKVRELWREYYDMLYTKGIDWKQLDTKRLELITEMAKVVGYGKKITHIDVDRVYTPVGLSEDRERMRKIGEELLRVLQESGGLQIVPKEKPKKKDEKKNVLNEILK